MYVCTSAFAQVSPIVSDPSASGDTIYICVGDTVEFSTLDPNPSGWLFPGGIPNNSADPVEEVVFGTPGVFQITHFASVGDIFIQVKVFEADSISFNFPSITLCVTDSLFHIDSIVSPVGGQLVGPGVVGNNFDPSAADTGSHWLVYTYVNSGGCVSIDSINLEIMPSPDPSSFSSNGTFDVFFGRPTYYFCTSSGNQTFQLNFTGVPYNYEYFELFIDDSLIYSDTVALPSFYPVTFQNTGIYPAKLNLYSANGCVSSKTIDLFFGANPSGGLLSPGNTVRCLPPDSSGVELRFPLQGFMQNETGTIYEFEINDGSPPVIFTHPPPDTFAHVFFDHSCGVNSPNAQNAYFVKLTITNPCGNTFSSVDPIVISAPSQAEFEMPDTACVDDIVEIENNAIGGLLVTSGPLGTVTQNCDTSATVVWEIDPPTFLLPPGNFLGDRFGAFTDPTAWVTGTSEPEVIFLDTGVYTIWQFIGSSVECGIDSFMQTICITNHPDTSIVNIEYGPDSTFCAPFTMTFSESGDSAALCSDVDWAWNITPNTYTITNTRRNGRTIDVTFDESDNYQVSMSKSSFCGNTVIDTMIAISSPPEVVMKPTFVHCGPTSIDYASDTLNMPFIDVNFGPTTFEWSVSPQTGWSFAGGTSASDTLPEIDFSDVGTYWVSLYAENQCGSFVDSQMVVIEPKPNITAFSDTLVCYGDTFMYVPAIDSSALRIDVEWATSNALTDTTPTVIIPNVTDTIVVTYVVQNSALCSDTVVMTVAPMPEILVNYTGPPSVCEQNITPISISVSGGVGGYQFQWFPDSAFVDPTQQNPSLIGPFSSVPISVMVTDSAGCSVVLLVPVSLLPPQPISAGPDINICAGDSVQLGDTAQMAATYSWTSIPAGFTSSQPNPWVIPTDTTTYILTALDSSGCEVIDSVNVNFLPAPFTDFTLPYDSICAHEPITTLNASDSNHNYQWFVDDTLVGTTYNVSFSLPGSTSGDTIYNVTLVLAPNQGCSDSVTVPLLVHQPTQAAVMVDSVACAGSTISTSNLSAGGGVLIYEWSSQQLTIIGANTSEPDILIPDFQGSQDSIFTYSLVVTSEFGCSDTVYGSILVNPRPDASFAVPNDLCVPADFSPVDLSVGNGLSYQWNVSPSTNVTIANAGTNAPIFNLPSTIQDSVVYNVFLTVTDVNGCVDSTFQQMIVYPNPLADFSISDTIGCQPFQVNFSSTSQQFGSMILHHYWDFGNGMIDSTSTPSSVFLNSGVNDTTYDVLLVVSNDLGCLDSTQKTITVHPDPKAQINVAGSNIGCTPFVLDSNMAMATDYSNANSSYTWEVLDVNDNVLTSTTGINGLNHVMPNDNDTVWVRLIAVSPYGCASDTTMEMFVTRPNPEVDFSLSDTISCTPAAVQTTNLTSQAISYQWLVNGIPQSTAVSPSFTFSNTGTIDSVVTIKLIAVSPFGCVDSLEKDVTILPQPQPNFAYVEVCDGDSTAFIDISTSFLPIVQWTWNFGDNSTSTDQNPKHLYGSPGAYAVTLNVTDTFGCQSTHTDTVIVRPHPQADFSLSTSSCYVDTICVNQADVFTDTSFIPNLGGNATEWQWDVGANGIVNYITPTMTHTFTDTGFVDIAFYVETQYGCFDSVVKTYYVLPEPTVGFSVDTTEGCDGHQVVLQQESSGYIETYSWTLFTLSSTGTPQIISTSTTAMPPVFPSLTASNSQDTVYYVSLTVATCCASDSMAIPITIKPEPTAFFVPSDTVACSPVNVNFLIDGQTIGLPDYIIMNYGDGRIDTISPQLINLPGGPVLLFGVQNHTFTYTGSGTDTTYVVTLTAVNACGTSTYSRTITVLPSTVTAFFTSSHISGCAPLSVSFNNLTANTLIANWSFDYDTVTGNWGTSTAQGNNPTFVYNNPGVYTIALAVNDGCGSDTSYRQITVLPSPTGSFGFNNNVCPGDSVFFTNTSTVSSGNIIGYNWSLGNGTNTNTLNAATVYDSAGVYQVCLIVQSNNGCSDTVCQNVNVIAKPIIDVDVNNLCFNEQPFVFTNLTTVPGGSVNYTQWDFGDGNTSGQFSPSHTYDSTGVYTIRLYHEGTGGCADSLTFDVHVYPSPEAIFSYSRPNGDSCGIPQSFQFTYEGSGASDFYWDFDIANRPDSITSTLENPSLTFIEFGRYDVRLVVTNGYGCTDTMQQQIVIQPSPEARFRATPLEGCLPVTVSFTDESTVPRPDLGGIARWEYHFGDGDVQDGVSPSTIHDYQDSGTYYPFLITHTEYGCVDTFYYPEPIKIYPTPIAGFNIDERLDGTFLLTNTSEYHPSDASFLWNTGDGARYATKDVTHRYQIDRLKNEHEFTICLKVETRFGCADSICEDVFLEKFSFFVPNAIAPEVPHAGEAAVFLPKGHSLAEYRMQIFDYWGNLIFETTELTNEGEPAVGWNGRKYNTGDLLPMGMYVWKIDALFEDGTRWPGVSIEDKKNPITSGPINLIR